MSSSLGRVGLCSRCAVRLSGTVSLITWARSSGMSFVWVMLALLLLLSLDSYWSICAWGQHLGWMTVWIYPDHCVWSTMLVLTTWSAICISRVCCLESNQWPFSSQPTLNPLSHTSQGLVWSLWVHIVWDSLSLLDLYVHFFKYALNPLLSLLFLVPLWCEYCCARYCSKGPLN